jgi:hypothetical protein
VPIEDDMHMHMCVNLATGPTARASKTKVIIYNEKDLSTMDQPL